MLVALLIATVTARSAGSELRDVGLLAALTHHLLGVDAADMLADFELTNLAARIEARLNVPGAHNVANALAALGAVRALGVPLGSVLKRFQPTSKAKYVAFTTLADPRQMPGLVYRSIDWPYREGLRIDEAMHPLTLLATGMYGKPLPNQNGAPLRLVVPWKYGFKSIKSIIRIDFTEAMPPTSWNMLQPEEYGFYSNVNPDVDHPRWSQRSERRIAGEGNRVFAERIATLPFNGYAEQVAAMYSGMDLRKWF